jgi:hypothetical protein
VADRGGTVNVPPLDDNLAAKANPDTAGQRETSGLRNRSLGDNLQDSILALDIPRILTSLLVSILRVLFDSRGIPHLVKNERDEIWGTRGPSLRERGTFTNWRVIAKVFGG